VLANSAQTSRRLRPVLAFCVLTVALLVGPLTLTAQAEGTATTFVADGNLAKDGTLKVTQTVTLSGTVPTELTQRFETREDLVGDRQYVHELTGVTATVNGAAVVPDIQTDGRFTTVTVATNGANEIVTGYTVSGAVVNIENGETALRWRLLQGLSAQVTEFSGTVQVPGPFSYVKCIAGAPNSTTPCASAAAGIDGSQTPTFSDGPRGEGEVVTVDIGFPPGAVTANEVIDFRWTVARAFSAKPLPLAIALGLLVLGGIALLLMHRRSGVDARHQGEVSRVGEFVPTGAGVSEFKVVGDVRPGHVGTVADERVDPIDITATLVDLAVRGHLLITELPRSGEFARSDWELTRLPGAGELRPFERQLLDGLTPVGGTVKTSELPSRVYDAIDTVQDALYDEVVTLGWFARRPDATRNRWTSLALFGLILAVAITGVLAAFTTFGLVGLALVVLALGLVFVGQEMPSRTSKGVALLGGLGALRSDLMSHPTDQMTPGTELQEISELLPYAIVLGGTERWLDAVVASDTDLEDDSEDLSWYHGPPNWQLRDLPDSLKNFTTTVSGSLFAR